MKNKGVALITALLIVALATITAVAITTRQQLDIHRTANIINGEQAYMYALGGEEWVKQILLDDNNAIDSFQDNWAISMPALPITGGSIQGQVEDLQGRFNLNNLVDAQPEDMAMFARLLQILELPPMSAQVVVDWIDADIEVYIPEGAEDNTYLPDYRTANTFLSSPSEIRLLKGSDKKSYQKLLPYISTLPTRTKINVNTASLPVLAALAEGLKESELINIMSERNKKPFKSVQEFLIQDAFAGMQLNTQNLSISSDYFLFTAEVKIDRGHVHLKSILHRHNNKIRVLMRSQGGE
ncbi:MAG: type II secretion system minor pseudopilin GspK [Thiomargarita sp.]|nr:type II secretion system minor pseudopilin GspK [Thiomargarita sp.]